VDKEKIKGDKRFLYGIPKTDNANYLWIQIFLSALNENGRAGFVMANSASDARQSELEIRKRIIEDQVVDVMIAVGSNFFYTVTLPCTLWFFDKGKKHTDRRDKVLFIDARSIYRQIDRAHREFRPEQVEFIANIVKLYRGESVETCHGMSLQQNRIPEGWEVRRLGEVGEIVMGQSPSSEFYNNTGQGLPFHQGVRDFGARFPVHITFCTIDKRIAERGDILLSVRAPVGRINIANTKIIIGRGLAALRHKKLLQSFLLYQLKNIFR